MGNYDDIFQMLNGQGWIAETPKTNYVRLTHWGVKEIKKSVNDAPFAAQIAKREATRLISDTKLLIIMLEEFASDTSEAKFEQVEKKMSEINIAIGKLKPAV